MADVSFHPEARDEYDRALGWYQSRSPQAATRFEAEVDRVVANIGAAPESFPAYDDDHRFAVLRRFPYSLVFRVLADGERVVAVAHSSRAPGYWAGRG